MKKLVIPLDDSLHARFKQSCIYHNTSMVSEITTSIHDWLKSYEVVARKKKNVKAR